MTERCATHPDKEATHECTVCHAVQCTGCLRPLATPGRSDPSYVCTDCGALAVALPEPEPTEKEDLRQALLRPFDLEGVLLIIALTIPAWLSNIPFPGFAFLFMAIYLGCLSAIYFQTIEHVGLGRAGLPFSASVTTRQDLVAALFRGVVCLSLGLGPAWVTVVFFPAAWPLALALLLVGLFIMPVVILSIVTSGHGANALNPFVWWQIYSRSPRKYPLLVGLFVASSVMGALLIALTFALLGWIPFFGGLFTGGTMTTVAVVQASLFGHWLRRYGWPFDVD